MNNLQFQYPEAFWLLAALPLFGLFYLITLWRRRKIVKRLGDPRLVKELAGNHSSVKSFFKFIFLMLAFGLGCIALANPRIPQPGENEAREGIDIVIALDVSNSMLATDVAPDRLSKTKLFISKLLARLKENRVGLVLFAGNAYIQSPLTYDHNALQLMLSAASPSIIAAQGTNVNEALNKAEIVFEISEDRYKLIVLVSDGEGHDESALAKVSELASEGVVIHTIGVGSAAGGRIMDPVTKTEKKDALGNPILSKLNEQYLKDMANTANGDYFHLDAVDDTVTSLFKEVDSAEKKALSDASLLNYETLYAPFAGIMLFLLILEIFVPDRKRK